MESQEGFIQNAAMDTNTNTMILNGESTYACNKAVETSCFLNAEKMRHGKRVLDMECTNEFQENIKKVKRQTDTVDHVNDVATTALYQLAETRYNEIKKPTDAVKNGKVYAEKREKLLKSFVNSRGKPACLICRVNFVSNKFLHRHMVLHTDIEWKTFIRSLNTRNVNKSGEDHNHDAKVDNLSKCLVGWNVKRGKRSSVADVKVNNVPNAVNKGKVSLEKGENLLMSFVNSRGKPACLMCRVNFVSNKFLYRHIALHSDKDWKTFIGSRNTHNVNKSGQDHNHDAKVDNLS